MAAFVSQFLTMHFTKPNHKNDRCHSAGSAHEKHFSNRKNSAQKFQRKDIYDDAKAPQMFGLHKRVPPKHITLPTHPAPDLSTS